MCPLSIFHIFKKICIKTTAEAGVGQEKSAEDRNPWNIIAEIEEYETTQLKCTRYLFGQLKK